MNKSWKIALCLLIVIIFFSYNKWVFSLGLFELFKEKRFSADGLKKIRDFNPDTDMLYLPGLDGKDFFESVDDLSICRRQEVREYIYIYLTSDREYLLRSIKRSHYYLPLIREILKQNPDIPGDIGLLPLLESGFDTEAVSRSNAVGLWQFVKNTSTHLGLKDDRWTDERRDIEKSTVAAIRHLRYLHKNLGSWELALAAYNCGYGQIKKCIKKTGAGDYWVLRDLGVLSYETGEYIPRYAALMVIYKNRRFLGLEDPEPESGTEPSETITLDKAVNVILMCRLCGIDRGFIRRYNPELKTDIAPSYDGTYTLRIPSGSVTKFISNRHSFYVNAR